VTLPAVFVAELGRLLMQIGSRIGASG
jgi:hypothetical protein